MHGGASKQFESATGFSDNSPAEMSTDSQHCGLPERPERVSVLDLEHVDDLDPIESITNSSTPQYDSQNWTQDADPARNSAYAIADQVAAQSSEPNHREGAAEPPEPMYASPLILIHPIRLLAPPITKAEDDAHTFHRNVMSGAIGAWRIAKAASGPFTNLAWGEFRHRFALWIGFECNPIDCCWEYHKCIIGIAGTRRMFDSALWMERYARRMHHAKRDLPWTVHPNRDVKRQFEYRMIQDPEF
ncbi:hypothetical protein KVT40_002618 [Elsinoe batatas]|uniref:Uncharacterized protein n=1 Tax=Elsinoe batatas TaxID=2601811 RepID=A0A8K0PIQ6_9PEZI|nr:hypothetical protein KVT40_002618 [Elsinoe batatas]